MTLRADTPHSLTDGEARWPVVDGIPYLRAGSEALAAEAVAALDEDAADEATALLLAENDPWWDEAPPPHDVLLSAVREKDRLSLREVMDRLGWGRVGTYFAHRWSDPTFLAGLTLLEAHWRAPESAFELACGIGHYLRALSRAGVSSVSGADVVFGKLWVCRHWVCPEADLLCFDADAAWPATPAADLMLCADAFYFLREKAAIAERLREGAGALYAVPHVHNAGAENHSAGAAARLDELRALFPGAAIYDDAGLTEAGAAGKPVRAEMGDAPDAFSLIGGPALGASALPCPLLRPEDGTPLRRNPLLTDQGVAWPSPRYEEEYGPLATYGRPGVPNTAAMTEGVAPFVRTRELLDLPERW
ncbi:hypothetical protein GGQ59_000905 [Parvularcula dongshanensis]|uniref:Methyltransferase type 11 n=2 Tax=Parvularcula dongshanensis TaxID=1173995 RepID=A0A840I242_9PROT|nr:hypothetical protein [Parvularcula dongshanensis]